MPGRLWRLEFTKEADAQRKAIEEGNPQKYKKVGRALGLLEQNPKHPSLETHRFTSLSGPNGEDLWVAYVENAITHAYRILWCYKQGERGVIVVAYVGPHY